MTIPTDAQRRAWVAQWRTACVALERVRLEEELRDVDLARVASDLDDASLAALLNSPPVPSSGLVEQQRFAASQERREDAAAGGPLYARPVTGTRAISAPFNVECHPRRMQL